jgi:hypothetical protein
LNNAILLKFAVTNNFRSKKKSQEGKCFVGNFNTKKSKHLINGLDREKVYAHGWAKSVVLVLDGFSLVDLEYDPPFDVIWVFPSFNLVRNKTGQVSWFGHCSLGGRGGRGALPTQTYSIQAFEDFKRGFVD